MHNSLTCGSDTLNSSSPTVYIYIYKYQYYANCLEVSQNCCHTIKDFFHKLLFGSFKALEGFWSCFKRAVEMFTSPK